MGGEKDVKVHIAPASHHVSFGIQIVQAMRSSLFQHWDHYERSLAGSKAPKEHMTTNRAFPRDQSGLFGSRSMSSGTLDRLI